MPHALQLLANLAEKLADTPPRVHPAFQEINEKASGAELQALGFQAARLQKALDRLPARTRSSLVGTEAIHFFRRDFPAYLEVLAVRAAASRLSARHKGLPHHAHQMAKTVRGLRQSSIVTLADHGFLRPRIGEQAATGLEVISVLTLLFPNPKAGKRLQGNGSGRKQDMFARQLGLILGQIYTRMTGRSPTIVTTFDPLTNSDCVRTGAWRTFIKDTFHAMGNPTGLEVAYREAVPKRKQGMT